MATTATPRSVFTDWFRSTRSNNGNQCVEIRFDGDAVLIRDSKYRRNPANRRADEPVITVTAAEWMDFLGAVRSGRPAVGVLTTHSAPGDHTAVRCGKIDLVYTPGEWDAFRAGSRDGEFDRIPLSA